MTARVRKTAAAKLRTLTVAGVMSGTSADGVDVAICRIGPGSDALAAPRLRVLSHASFRYPKPLRAAVLAAAGAQQPNSSSVPELARLSWRLGDFYADCVEAAANATARPIDLVAMHGQTIYHQPVASKFLGKPVRCTWQTGEPSLLVERLRVPVLSDFRTADMAAGGQGAPLVPMLDFCFFRHATRNRILLNLGGIANVSVLPAGCTSADVLAFDTGPANMVIDSTMGALFGRSYDRNGVVARKGRVLTPALDELAADHYFTQPPPKSCGREEFGAEFTLRLIAMCRRAGARNEDTVATAMELTLRTIEQAYARWCWPLLGQKAPAARGTDLIVAGGGAKNATLMHRLTRTFARYGVRVTTTESAGIATEAKEAAAFALLGWLRWHGLPGNIPSATGASRSVILGRLS